jgi:hypothetical protein
MRATQSQDVPPAEWMASLRVEDWNQIDAWLHSMRNLQESLIDDSLGESQRTPELLSTSTTVYWNIHPRPNVVRE